MKNNIVIGLTLGIVAGILDVIPMVLQGLTWDANLSAFFLWVVSGFMLATSNLNLHPVVKGIVIPFLCLLPSTFIIGWNEPLSLVPIGVMTLILGALLGFAYGKLSKQQWYNTCWNRCCLQRHGSGLAYGEQLAYDLARFGSTAQHRFHPTPLRGLPAEGKRAFGSLSLEGDVHAVGAAAYAYRWAVRRWVPHIWVMTRRPLP